MYHSTSATKIVLLETSHIAILFREMYQHGYDNPMNVMPELHSNI
jgi:hypothetical protein